MNAAVGLFLAAGIAAATAPDAGPIAWERHEWKTDRRVNAVDSLPAAAGNRRWIVAAGEQRVWLIDRERAEPRVLLDTTDGRIMTGAAADLDDDGHVDYVLGRFLSPWALFRQKAAAGETARPPSGPDFSVAWLRNPGDPGAEWTLHPLDQDLDQVHGVATGDFNGDGTVDVVANSLAGGASWADSITWHEGPFAPGDPPAHRRHVLTRGGAPGRSHYFHVHDRDGDEPDEVLLTASGAGTLTRWTADPRGGPWKPTVLARKAGLTNVVRGDLNGRGFTDLVFSCGHGVGIHALMGPDFRQEVAIDREIRDVHALAAADLTGNGLTDIAAVSNTERIVFWLENLGDGIFRRHVIDTGGPQEAYDLRAADVDGDGRTDLIIAGRASNNVLWLRNQPAR